ncbi:MAG: EthD family reductase [Betaproteobacteria bacterium]|nr:EthD family reductase [Betaproteobacteria bacterium]
MIKVSVFYPNSENCRFDIDYYCKSHMPMVRDKLGVACKGVAVDKGIAGGTPGSRPVFVAIGHLYFETVEAFQAAMGPCAKEIFADVPNYTNIEPSIQISSVAINAAADQVGDLHIHSS